MGLAGAKVNVPAARGLRAASCCALALLQFALMSLDQPDDIRNIPKGV
jgi:hypothetical protein